MVSIDHLKEVLHGLFKEPIIGPPKFKMAEIRQVGHWHDVIFLPIWIKFDRLVHNDYEIWFADRNWHEKKDVDKIWVSSRIRSSKDSDMTTSINSEVIWSHRSRHLEIVYDVITPQRLARFGRNLVAWCGIARDYYDNGRSSNRKKKSNMTDVYFLSTKCGL